MDKKHRVLLSEGVDFEEYTHQESPKVKLTSMHKFDEIAALSTSLVNPSSERSVKRKRENKE